MKQVTPQSASAYVDAIELPQTRGITRGVESADEVLELDADKNQAAVVGSEVVSFAKGVSVARRSDIVNCALLAQLVANKRVSDRTQLIQWYKEYFDVLSNLGWTLENNGFSSYEEKADGLEAHEAILKVAAVVLGAAPTALAIVTSTIQAMKSMDADNPWITIFDRESKQSNTARFQVSLAEQSGSNVSLSLMAFALEAQSTLTQVLFFKIRRDKVRLQQCATQVGINKEVLDAVRGKVKSKLAGMSQDFVDSLDL
jgi:hypothetical protein